MLINPAVGGDQGILSIMASVHAPEIVLIDEVVNQSIPQLDQFFEITFCPREIYSRKPQIYPNAHRANIVKRTGLVVDGYAVLVGNNIGTEEVSDQGA